MSLAMSARPAGDHPFTLFGIGHVRIRLGDFLEQRLRPRVLLLLSSFSRRTLRLGAPADPCLFSLFHRSLSDLPQPDQAVSNFAGLRLLGCGRIAAAANRPWCDRPIALIRSK